MNPVVEPSRKSVVHPEDEAPTEKAARPISPEIQFDLQLWPAQRRAFYSPATEILYGGAAGGGKSHLMRVAAIAWCMAVPGLQVYFFRRQYPDLILNHIDGPEGFPVLLASLIANKTCRRIGMKYVFANGSRINLCHLHHAKDLSKYHGAEIHVLIMDELTHFTEKEYRFLRGRCRIGGLKVPIAFKGLFPRIISGSNPGSIGHHWVKQSFVEKGAYRINRQVSKEGGMLRQYIPARTTDNPSLLQNDPDYIDKLEGLGDPALVRAMVDGDWDCIAGAVFGPLWRRDKHVCAPFAIPAHWEMWRGGDDGFYAPAAVEWFARHPDTMQIFVIRELYRPGMGAIEFHEHVERIDKEITVVDFTGAGKSEARYLNARLKGTMDSQAFTQSGQSQITRGEQMNKLGDGWTPAEKWPGSRIAGLRNLGQLLMDDKKTKQPGIVFFNTCVNAIRTIPALPRDENDVEDVDTAAEDHAYDAVRYGLQFKKSKVEMKKLVG